MRGKWWPLSYPVRQSPALRSRTAAKTAASVNPLCSALSAQLIIHHAWLLWGINSKEKRGRVDVQEMQAQGSWGRGVQSSCVLGYQGYLAHLSGPGGGRLARQGTCPDVAMGFVGTLVTLCHLPSVLG